MATVIKKDPRKAHKNEQYASRQIVPENVLFKATKVPWKITLFH